MLGSSGVLQNRKNEFQLRLASMNGRAHEIAQGSCYMCFVYPALGDKSERFIQFSFEKDCFHLDIPCQTLSREEAARISASRPGFFYLSDGPQYTLHEEDTEGSDPFRTVYFYGDECTAADDMAHIFYSIWQLSISVPIYVTASSFNDEHHWESDHPLFWNAFEE